MFAPRRIVVDGPVIAVLEVNRVMPFLPTDMGATDARENAFARLRVAEVVCGAVNGTVTADEVPGRMEQVTEALLARGVRSARSITSTRARHEALRDALGLADHADGIPYRFDEWTPSWSH